MVIFDKHEQRLNNHFDRLKILTIFVEKYLFPPQNYKKQS